MIARNMHLFPLAGMAIGLIAGGIGLGLSEAGADPLVVALLVVAVIAVITGIHHTDGLADFADGMMAGGDKERKISAMRDSSVGSAGVTAVVLYIVGMVVALSLAGGTELLKAVLFAEVAAKLSMVLMAWRGRTAAPGSGSPFVSAMKGGRRAAFAVIISAIPLVILGGWAGLAVLSTGVISSVILVSLSSRSFGGITGDVMGAANELTRLASVLVFVSI
ncbi:cobalamin-5-phosphate synthase [Cenarchaeum symbiosum A]|uniref:Adenosylcobinamide-GDP ribazoletransferase n=1 Tax=Cenarchaeum symbiosum (strain A) TaxID=414004 RepID=A0RZ34_CENSY|nr:cobalamin-5-phosphate synthase [Cenarchaeum symbiosum A]